MAFPSKEKVESLRREYPAGTRIEVTQISDLYSKLTAGDRGTVDFVDDTGSLFCAFDNGEHIGLLYGVDGYRKITVMPDGIRRCVQAVRATGATNMFDWKNVVEIAKQCGFDELAAWLPENVKLYANYILTGKTEDYDA